MKIKKETGCWLGMFLGGMYSLMEKNKFIVHGSLIYLLMSVFIDRMFLGSVKKLRIMKTSEAKGLGMFSHNPIL